MGHKLSLYCSDICGWKGCIFALAVLKRVSNKEEVEPCRYFFKAPFFISLSKLYFPLAEEQNEWKMFSHTPLRPRPEGCFESCAQCCLSVAFLLSVIADENFRAPVPT